MPLERPEIKLLQQILDVLKEIKKLLEAKK